MTSQEHTGLPWSTNKHSERANLSHLCLLRCLADHDTGSYKQTLACALRPENVAKAKSQTEELLSQLLVIYEEHNRPGNDTVVQWLFGPRIGPTMLDAHTTAFIARLDDSGQENLVPGALLSYARRKFVLPAWKAVCHGRKTLWNVDYGHVHMLVNI